LESFEHFQVTANADLSQFAVFGTAFTGACLAGSTERHAPRNGFKNSERKGIVKIHSSKGQAEFWDGLIVIWLFSDQIFALNRENSIKSRQTHMQHSFFWRRVPNNSE
ncbi:hypothetical protein ACFL0Q_08715, partial [Thermodesulfobacteriota bacterium]